MVVGAALSTTTVSGPSPGVHSFLRASHRSAGSLEGPMTPEPQTPEPHEYERYKALVLIDRLLKERRPEEEIAQAVELLSEGDDEHASDSPPVSSPRRRAA